MTTKTRAATRTATSNKNTLSQLSRPSKPSKPSKPTEPSKPSKSLRPWTRGLFVGLLATVAARPALATCYTPTEQTAGWKRAAIPDGAPALAVADPLAHTPRDFIEQFRSGEPAVVWLGSEHGSMSLGERRPGRVEYVFRVDGAQWQILQLQLAGDLAGAKVDVIAYRDGGATPLWFERRATGSTLPIEWAMAGVYSVSVSFHHHLRERPVVTSWQAGLRTKVSEAAWAPTGFRQTSSLYYYHPGGRTLILCNEPYHELAVRRESLISVTPAPVKLVPR